MGPGLMKGGITTIDNGAGPIVPIRVARTPIARASTRGQGVVTLEASVCMALRVTGISDAAERNLEKASANLLRTPFDFTTDQRRCQVYIATRSACRPIRNSTHAPEQIIGCTFTTCSMA